MNKIVKSNIFSLIEVYILNEELIPTYNNLIAYSPIIKNALNNNKFTKEDTGKLILEFFVNKIELYYKNTGKFPFRENLLKYTPEYKTIFGIFKGQFESKYDTLMLHYFRKSVLTGTKTKMKLSLQERYNENITLFEDFFLLNLYKENRTNNEFQDAGAEIKEIIQDVENYIVGRMEGGQYGVFSGSTRDKFIILVKSIFPQYDQIGVKIRHI